MSNFDFTEGLFGFSDFGIGGGVMTANKPKKKETKKTEKKRRPQQKLWDSVCRLSCYLMADFQWKLPVKE